MRRHDVALTSMRRCFDVMCLLGVHSSFGQAAGTQKKRFGQSEYSSAKRTTDIAIEDSLSAVEQFNPSRSYYTQIWQFTYCYKLAASDF